MNIEKARAILEKDYLCLRKNRELKGLNRLSKFCDELDFSAEHDQICICGFEETVENMSEKDVIYMAECMFFEEEGSWSFFV